MDQISKNVIQQLIDYQKQPCISIYISGQQPSGANVEKMRIKYKNTLADAEKKLEKDWDFSRRDIEEFLQEAEKLTGERPFWQQQRKGLAVFIGPDFFEYYRIPVAIKKQVDVNRQFNLMGIIAEYFSEEQYFVLALSKKESQFYQVSKNSIEKISVEGMPETQEEFSKGVQIEEGPRYKSQTGAGSGQSNFHGEDIGDDVFADLMQKYFRKINKAIKKYAGENTRPLILMCVENIFPAYQDINTYPQLIDDFVKGNPDKVPVDKIKKLSQEKMKNYFDQQISEKIEQYQEIKNSEKSSSDLEEIVIASFFGKVDRLFIKKDSRQPGKYDTEENEVILADDESKEHYDLYNFAAGKAFSTGAEIQILPEEKMPDNAEIAAIFRF